MTKAELVNYIRETYDADGEHPWADYPEHMVFRHASNRKWFALIMTVPEDKLGLPGGGLLDVVNLRCGPILAASLRGRQGCFPAYHMNKTYWITLALDGSAPEEEIRALLDVSYEATRSKRAR